MRKICPYQESNPEYNVVCQVRYPGFCLLMAEGTTRLERPRRTRVCNVEKHHEKAGCETMDLFGLFWNFCVQYTPIFILDECNHVKSARKTHLSSAVLELLDRNITKRSSNELAPKVWIIFFISLLRIKKCFLGLFQQSCDKPWRHVITVHCLGYSKE